jgi:branched-chain amino acid transport system permease protein
VAIHLSAATILSHIVVGLAQGMILVLMALGLSLIFGLLGVVNFAHGSLFVLGAFAGYFVLVQTDNFWLALLVGPLFVGLVGLGVERFLVRPLYSRRSADDALLVTFGFSLIVLDAVRMIWGKRGVEFDAPSGFEGAIDLGFTLFPTYRLLVIGITLVVVIALRTFLARTDIGLIVRAGTSNGLMTRALGIRLGRVRLLMFGLGSALAGLAGVLSGPMRQVSPEMGVSMVIDAFVVVVVGGMGSLKGAFVAGLILGQVVSLTQMVAPTMGGIVIFVAMAMVLLIRPSGLFGEPGFMD